MGTELEEGLPPVVLVVVEGAVVQVKHQQQHAPSVSDLFISSTSSMFKPPHSFALYCQESKGLAVHQRTALRRHPSAQNMASASAVLIR